MKAQNVEGNNSKLCLRKHDVILLRTLLQTPKKPSKTGEFTCLKTILEYC